MRRASPWRSAAVRDEVRRAAAHVVPAAAWPRVEALWDALEDGHDWCLLERNLARAPDDPRVDVLVCSLARDARARPIPQVWLEHDMLDDGWSAPHVLWTVDPSYPALRAPPPSAARIVDVSQKMLALVGADAAALASLPTLGACCEALPRGGRALHVCCMRGRPGPLRAVFAVPALDVVPWLAKVGWWGMPVARDAMLDLVLPMGLVTTQLDLAPDGVRPTLGLEFSTATPGDVRWQRFMRGLVRLELASAAQVEGMLAFEGDTVLAGSTLRRRLDVKLVLDSEGGVIAKAYLGFVVDAAASASVIAPAPVVAPASASVEVSS